MTAQMLKGYLEAEMRRYDFPYTEINGFLAITAGFGGKRWKMALSCAESGIVCYAAYPWRVPGERRARALEKLNGLNAEAGYGSYFLLGAGRDLMIVLRCDIIIADEYSIAECVEMGFKRTAAAVCARWDALFALSAGNRAARGGNA